MDEEGGFDPCECIWGHEMSMRRLLALLRQSQAYCTDTECFEDVIGPRNQHLDNCFLLMVLACTFAIAMYYFRPNSQRHALENVSKPNNNDSNGSPPGSPPTVS